MKTNLFKGLFEYRKVSSKRFAVTFEFLFDNIRRLSKRIVGTNKDDENENLFSYGGIALVFYGFYNVLHPRYREQFLFQFFQTNLPAFSIPSQKLNWETFREIGLRELSICKNSSKDSTVDAPGSKIEYESLFENIPFKKIELNGNFLKIQFQPPWHKIKKQEFVGFFTILEKKQIEQIEEKNKRTHLWKYSIPETKVSLCYPPQGGKEREFENSRSSLEQGNQMVHSVQRDTSECLESSPSDFLIVSSLGDKFSILETLPDPEGRAAKISKHFSISDGIDVGNLDTLVSTNSKSLENSSILSNSICTEREFSIPDTKMSEFRDTKVSQFLTEIPAKIQKPSFFRDFVKKREEWSSIAARKLVQWPELSMNKKKTNKFFIFNSQKISFFLKNRALISFQFVNNDSYPVLEIEKKSKTISLEKKAACWKQNMFWFLDEIPCKIDSFPELESSAVFLPDRKKVFSKELVGEDLDLPSKEYLSIPCIEVNLLPQKISFTETKVSKHFSISDGIDIGNLDTLVSTNSKSLENSSLLSNSICCPPQGGKEREFPKSTHSFYEFSFKGIDGGGSNTLLAGIENLHTLVSGIENLSLEKEKIESEISVPVKNLDTLMSPLHAKERGEPEPEKSNINFIENSKNFSNSRLNSTDESKIYLPKEKETVFSKSPKNYKDQLLALKKNFICFDKVALPVWPVPKDWNKKSLVALKNIEAENEFLTTFKSKYLNFNFASEHLNHSKEKGVLKPRFFILVPTSSPKNFLEKPNNFLFSNETKPLFFSNNKKNVSVSQKPLLLPQEKECFPILGKPLNDFQIRENPWIGIQGSKNSPSKKIINNFFLQSKPKNFDSSIDEKTTLSDPKGRAAKVPKHSGVPISEVNSKNLENSSILSKSICAERESSNPLPWPEMKNKNLKGLKQKTSVESFKKEFEIDLGNSDTLVPGIENFRSSLEQGKQEETVVSGIVFTSSRLMSGYLWPDMKKNDIVSSYTSLVLKFLYNLKSLSFFDLNEKLLLQDISILLPSSFSIPSFASINIEKKPIVHLSYKKSEFPGFRYIKALLENSNFPLNVENRATVAKNIDLEEKKKLNTGSDWWWIKWFKKGIFFILRQNLKEKLLYVGPVVARQGESATLLFKKKNLIFFEQWVEKFQKLLGSEQDSFFGEPKILVGEIPVERENLEFPSEYLKTLEGELLPFGAFDKIDFLSKFEPLSKSTEIAFDEITVPFSLPLFSMKQKGKIPELTLYEWYNLLRLQMESGLENQESEKNLENIEFHLPNIIVAETKTSDIFSPLTFLNYQNGGAPLFNKANPGADQNTSVKVFQKASVPPLPGRDGYVNIRFKVVENIVSSLMFYTKNNLVIYPTKLESGWSQNFLFQKPWAGKWYQTKTEKKGLKLFPAYTTNIVPWASDPVNGLSKNICFANGSYKKIPTHFEKKRFWFNPIDQLLKFSSETLQLQEPFQENWESMTISSWMIVYKLVYILWIQESLKILYRRYGKEILGNLVSIFAALGFDMSEIIEFLELNHTDSGLRVIEKSRKDFADIAGMDHMLPELSEFVWLLRTKGTLPMFQNSPPSLLFSDLSSSLLIVRPFLFYVGKESNHEKKTQDLKKSKFFKFINFIPARRDLFWNPAQMSYRLKKDESLKFKKWPSKPLSPFSNMKGNVVSDTLVSVIKNSYEERELPLRAKADTNTFSSSRKKIKKFNKSSNQKHNHFKNLNEFKKTKGFPFFPSPFARREGAKGKGPFFLNAPTLFIPPKGTLLVGPPGTGKTFLVQAIAGEANVPVVIQSASALMELDQKQSPSQLLRKLFDKARELSPCILFIDEVDTLGSSRENVLLDSSLTEIGNDPSMESFLSIEDGKSFSKAINEENSLIVNTSVSFNKGESFNSNEISDIEEESTGLSKQLLREAGGEMPAGEILQSHERKSKISKQQLAILMQFLVEMDGLKKLSGVVLIGATNRPSVLDPAFVRPGRFEKTIRLEIPNKQKRIEILKHYSKSLGFEYGINWDYLGNRTAGFTAADLSSAMNQSSINAILQKLDSPFLPKHTVNTVEKGIEAISRERGSRTLSSLESKMFKKTVLFETDNFLGNLTEKERIENLQNFVSPKDLELSSITSINGISAGIPVENLDTLVSRNLAPEGDRIEFSRSSVRPSSREEKELVFSQGKEEQKEQRWPAQRKQRETLSRADLVSRKEEREKKSFKGRDIKESQWTFFLTTNLQILTLGGHSLLSLKHGLYTSDGEASELLFDSKKNIIKDPFFLTRFAFYQAGKATLQLFFPLTSKISIFSLSNNSSQKLDFISKRDYINQRSEWESQIINCYAGKASELLALGTVVPLRKEKRKEKIAKEKLNFETFKKAKNQSRNRVIVPNQSRFAVPEGVSSGDTKVSKFSKQMKFASLLLPSSFPKKRTYPLGTDVRASGDNKVSKFAIPNTNVSEFPREIQNCNNSSFFKNSLYPLSNLCSPFKEVQKISPFKELWASSIGLEDLKNGTLIAHFLVEEWYLYSRKIASSNVLPSNKNKKEISDPYVLDSLKHISFKHKEEISKQYISQEKNQEFFIPTWWQLEVTKNYDVGDLSFGEWYRIFLSDPEEGERNEEWVAPDEHYSTIETLQNISNFFLLRNSKIEKLSDKSFNSFSVREKKPFETFNYACKLNELPFESAKNENSKSLVTSKDSKKLIRDYIFYGLVSNGFNVAYDLLYKNREILDLFADCLVRFEKIREPEIANFSFKFFSENSLKRTKTFGFFQNKNKKIENLKSLAAFPFLVGSQGYEYTTPSSLVQGTAGGGPRAPLYAERDQRGVRMRVPSLDFQEFSVFRNTLKRKEKTLSKYVTLRKTSSSCLAYEHTGDDLGIPSVAFPPPRWPGVASEPLQKEMQGHRASLASSFSSFFEKKENLRTPKNLLKDKYFKDMRGDKEMEPWWGRFSRKPYKRLIGLDTIRRM